MTWQPNKLEQERLDKADQLRQLGIDPFPGQLKRTHTIAEATAQFQNAEANPTATPITVAVCGRIRMVRSSGKVSFADIEDGTGRVQLFVRLNDIGEEGYEQFRRYFDLFDFVQAEGDMMRTKAGEISVGVRKLTMLAKALSPLPVIKEEVRDGQTVTHGGFTDVEERFRQRYADLASNAEMREVFRARAKVVRAVRDFFDERQFLEVETPILQPLYGGAAARPFTTHHNQLKQELYLRISFELYLKRLLVGMYDGVYEIGRDFRNEGVSYRHNPEFTMLEWYWAYADYQDNMLLTEQLFEHIAMRLHGKTEIQFNGQSINLQGPWKRQTMREAIREKTGIDYMDYQTVEALLPVARAKGLHLKDGLPWGKVVEELFSNFVEPTLIQPTFICDYPRDISPFAKAVPNDPYHVQRFEFYISGMEFGNAFTELNDPQDQAQRFADMAALYADDADDAAPIDEDYLRAMRYGMPPNSGEGIGIDRLVMLMTDKHTIREVLLFPHLRDKAQKPD
jgi:lysyl-tRNA synthetase, class II